MTPAILVFIALMWFPIALLLLGHGEVKGTGWATLVVGTLVVIGATLQAVVYKDNWTAGLLYVHGIFYLTVGWSFYTGQTDLRAMGNVSLTTALVSTIYAVVWLGRWTERRRRTARGPGLVSLHHGRRIRHPDVRGLPQCLREALREVAWLVAHPRGDHILVDPRLLDNGGREAALLSARLSRGSRPCGAQTRGSADSG